MVSYLRMEENPLKTLAYFEKLERIKTLYLTGNRIAEIQEIDRLIDLQYLVEISLQNNPLARKPMYRASIIKKLPNVQIIDSKEISLEERERIEVAIMQGANVGDPKPHPMIHYA
jgi:Leucine-rich repeat (LRR) protein